MIDIVLSTLQYAAVETDASIAACIHVEHIHYYVHLYMLSMQRTASGISLW